MKRRKGASETDPRKEVKPEGYPAGGDSDTGSTPASVEEGEVFTPDHK